MDDRLDVNPSPPVPRALALIAPRPEQALERRPQTTLGKVLSSHLGGLTGRRTG
jgi:hypothetical protein